MWAQDQHGCWRVGTGIHWVSSDCEGVEVAGPGSCVEEAADHHLHTTNKVINNKVINNKVVNNKVINNKVVNNKVINKNN